LEWRDTALPVPKAAVPPARDGGYCVAAIPSNIGDGHFVSEYQMTGSSQGKRFVCDGVDVIAVAEGRIARKDTYLDWPAVQRQLGPDLKAL
jgi:hypothetical protein